MNIALSDKSHAKKELLRSVGWEGNTRAIIFGHISDVTLREDLVRACRDIRVCLIDLWHPEFAAGYDAILSDSENIDEFGSSITEYGIVPIVSESQKYGKKFSTFLPMKFSGNAFIFPKNTIFPIFEQICRFLENTNYPGDKRVLLQNVKKIEF